ncbi:exodeoxyribonuclease V subunit alpha [Aggregatibacter actinomycetemcomitans]|uniref:exodeoxyribonuclease V subunit alpha n=1 Tax=Aggregatibacter actinomycetemcomitans TaxID=714 RepID=UPI00077E5A75|nr:exodeoxyribonuclease V subunit alpha [Aggregatibacter actinomycetemcomitans]KYK95251.1 exodeoxyribonuclease V subunit alpha [Aggregatibacter actinomycetemcomitans serotype e str. ANH9776]
MLALLSQLKEKGIINAADYYFAEFIHRKQQPFHYAPPIQNLAVLMAALCNFSYRQGNTCILLNHATEQDLFGLQDYFSERVYLTDIRRKIDYLLIDQWQAALPAAQHIAFTAAPLQQVAPLVLQFGRLYFYRIWQDEFRIADYFKSAVRFQNVFSAEQMAQIAPILNRYFHEEQGIDWQKIAVAMALRQRFCLITGGPGTGKTTTVTKLLLTLQELHQNGLRIKLVAPTGKAAARLMESIVDAVDRLKQTFSTEKHEREIIESLRIPMNAETIHRLLGVRFFSEETRYHADNPLPVDVLVVDEASMIDLTLMAKLLNALKPETKLILLGDKDQLASVEAGAILGELGRFVNASAPTYSPVMAQYLQATTGISLAASDSVNPISDSICYLQVSRRFGANPEVGALATAVNSGNAAESWRLLQQYQQHQGKKCGVYLTDFAYYLDNKEDIQQRKACVKLVVERAAEEYARYLQLIAQVGQPDKEKVRSIFAAFNGIRFLTALRVGEFGAEQLNLAIAEKLRQKRLLQFHQEREWYIGKPIMVMQNDGNVGLYNGDIGIYLGNGQVWFEQGQNSYKTVLASRVPNHETAFVMTVHKSQGSEFPHTFLILPLENSPVLSKELVYTGITRTKDFLTVFALQNVWESAVKNPVQRQSGLGQLLEI